MKTLNANQLALYLGCEVEIEFKGNQPSLFFLTSYALAMFPNSENVLSVKPILRPLADITEEEIVELGKVVFPDFSEVGFADKTPYSVSVWLSNPHNMQFDHEEIRFKRIAPIGTVYLLSRGFDLFNWIDQGLAIDKTKMAENLNR